jgi:hypothetical protein
VPVSCSCQIRYIGIYWVCSFCIYRTKVFTDHGESFRNALSCTKHPKRKQGMISSPSHYGLNYRLLRRPFYQISQNYFKSCLRRIPGPRFSGTMCYTRASAESMALWGAVLNKSSLILPPEETRACWVVWGAITRGGRESADRKHLLKTARGTVAEI